MPPPLRLAAVCVALAAGCARLPERPDVLLVTVDTLRPDRMSLYGYGRTTTPHIDAFARDAVVFTRAQTPRAKTAPAVASLLTGLYPHLHGVRDLASPLDEDVPVLAEAFRAAGWATAAAVGNWVLTDARSGLARGFETWDEELPDRGGVPPDDVPERRAGRLTDRALRLLDLGPTEPGAARDERPRFVWLHYMDPHGLYDPPEAWRGYASPPDVLPPLESLPRHPIQRPRLADYNVPSEARGPDGRIDAARVRDLYDGEVSYVDAELGRLFDALHAAGRLDRTLVVLTADHGESLGEHRYWFEHGFYAYETTCRVPLLVRLPRRAGEEAPRGVRDGDVSLVDLAPTLLELCGLPQLPRLPRHAGADPIGFGASRAALLRGRGAAAEAVFSEKIERADVSGTVQHKAVRRGEWKLVRRLARAGPESPLSVLSEELYGLALDPGERADLSASPPPEAPLAELRAALDRFTAADVHLADLARLLQRRREALERDDPDAVRNLEALGY